LKKKRKVKKALIKFGPLAKVRKGKCKRGSSWINNNHLSMKRKVKGKGLRRRLN
jgi:hypothetical protein